MDMEQRGAVWASLALLVLAASCTGPAARPPSEAPASRGRPLVEIMTHLAFYVGWPNAMSAVTRATELLEKTQPE